MTEIEHYEFMAGQARHQQATFLSYLDWSGDADQREWAQKMSDARRAEAEAFEQFATVLRGRAVTA